MAISGVYLGLCPKYMLWPEHWIIGLKDGDSVPIKEIPDQEAERWMDKLAEAAGFRSTELSGFTLFHHQGKGWQMSVRRKDEQGWDVKIIPDEHALAILSLLKPIGHPDGPMIPVVDDIYRGLWARETVLEQDGKRAPGKSPLLAAPYGSPAGFLAALRRNEAAREALALVLAAQ